MDGHKKSPNDWHLVPTIWTLIIEVRNVSDKMHKEGIRNIIRYGADLIEYSLDSA